MRRRPRISAVNAADAAVLSQVAIGLLRQQIPGDHRIACFVAEAGHVTNIIPDRAVVQFECRAFTLDGIRGPARARPALFRRCRPGHRNNAGHRGNRTPLRTPAPGRCPGRALDRRNGRRSARTPRRSAGLSGGSTDMGNISQVIPSLHPWLSIPGRGRPDPLPRVRRTGRLPGGLRRDVRGRHRAGLDRRRRGPNPTERARFIKAAYRRRTFTQEGTS